jgi:putative SOS response-associated peptidase YedK
MCYDIKASLESQLNRAKRKGDEQALREIKEKLLPYTQLPIFHASGFSHPKLLIYTNRSPHFPEVASWGLVPHWIQDREQFQKFWNHTLNARGETLFEKPSFRDAAIDQRCVIYIDGFYEHHHFKGKSYPYYIHPKKGGAMALAGLWNEWTDRATGEILNTFTIVTTEGNSLMTKIHNNPKLSGPRMPLILSLEAEEKWLSPIDQKNIEKLIHPYNHEALEAYTVGKLRGKEYLGNAPETAMPKLYPELQTTE